MSLGIESISEKALRVLRQETAKTEIKLIPATTNQMVVDNCILVENNIPATKASESQKSGIPS